MPPFVLEEWNVAAGPHDGRGEEPSRRHLEASEPRLVIEVLSPATRDFDAFEKLAEYRKVGCVAL
jgi:Uma2 family endonuclease